MLEVHYLFSFPLFWYDLKKNEDGRNEFGIGSSSHTPSMVEYIWSAKNFGNFLKNFGNFSNMFETDTSFKQLRKLLAEVI